MMKFTSSFDVSETTEIDIPLGIVEYLQKRSRKSIKSYFNQAKRYSVSDIISCRRQAYYKQLGMPEEELIGDATTENMWNSVRGDLLHQITYAYRWRELDTEYLVHLKDGSIATIVGRLDMYDRRTKTIIDLKTTKAIKWQIKQGFLPRLEHILQVQCYFTIFSEVIPVEHLNLVYVDMNEIMAYRVRVRNMSDWLKVRVQEIEDSIVEMRIPKGDVSALCKYCRYQATCYADGNGLKEMPRDTLNLNVLQTGVT
jgi:CRISPR/Cas system-associated exonuclease Cas4 (RecB family)